MQGQYTEVSWTGGWFNGFNLGPYYAAGNVKNKSGSKVPGWRMLIKQARNATGPYSLSVTNETLLQGSASFSINNPNQGGATNVWTVSGVLHGNPRPLAPALPVVTSDAQARIAFMKKVRKSRRSFQGGVFLGELREAIHMITRPASAFRQAITTYHSSAKKAVRAVRGSKAISRAITGTYLEATYGWAPLLSDVDAGMKTLANVPRLILDYTSGYAEDTVKATEEVGEGYSSNVVVVTRLATESFNSTRYKGAVGYEGGSNMASDWKSNWGVSLSDFTPTIYELIPYSFLVDYFSNLGAIVDAHAMGVVSLRWGFCTQRQRATKTVVSTSLSNTGWPESWKWKSRGVSQPSGELMRFAMNRSSVSAISVGISDFQMRVPGIDDWRKWANIGALAAQRVL